MNPAGNNSGESALESVVVWDAHVHCYPEKVIADPLGWARQRGESHWADLVSNGPQGWAGPETLLREMDAQGIEKVLLQAWYWEQAETARLQNDWHAEWVGAYPDRIMACAAVHPDMENPEAVLSQARDWGACGVGECLPQVQAARGWSHPAWQEILAWTSAEQWPLTLHVTEPVGHDYPGRVQTCLMALVDVLEQHPSQKWILAHWGGGLPFYAMNHRVRRALKNVWFDSAASPLLYDARIWRQVVGLVGAEKVVFGSDFPLRLYPRKEKAPGWLSLLEEFNQSGLDEADRQAIGRDNLQRLLGIDAPAPGTTAR